MILGEVLGELLWSAGLCQCDERCSIFLTDARQSSNANFNLYAELRADYQIGRPIHARRN